MPNLEACDEMLESLDGAPIDPASVEVARSLAAAVDADPQNAQLWRQYRDALADLRALADRRDGWSELEAELNGDVQAK